MVHASSETRSCGGGADCARPEIRRMVSASDRRSRAAFRHPDTGGLKRRVASSGTDLALRWRSGNARAPERGQARSPASVPDPQDGPPQARFHPRPGCRPALTRTRNEDFSGGWLGRSSRQSPLAGAVQGRSCRQRNPPVQPPPPSLRRTLRPAPGGLPPARSATFAGPSGSGSGRSMASGEDGVEEMGPGFTTFGILAPRPGIDSETP